MSDDKDEIAEDLGHHKEMLRVLRRRLRERELQEAKHGINVPDNITSEIHDITERIQRHESEIARLKSEVAEDKEPLAEVEYRALVAKAWDTGSGRPTVVGAVQLEFDRLRLGVAVERAQEIEQQVRVDLCKEYLSIINKYDFLKKIATIPSNASDPDKKTWDYFELQLIELRRAVQLNLSNVISWLMEAAYINVDFLPNVKPLLILHEKICKRSN